MCTRCHPTTVPREAPIAAVGQANITLADVWASIDHPHDIQRSRKSHRRGNRRTRMEQLRDRLTRAFNIDAQRSDHIT